MSTKEKIENGLNYVIRIAVGLLGLTIIICMLWILLGGGKSDKKPEFSIIIFGVFGGILFIRYAIRGNKQKIPNKTKGLMIKACEEGNIHYLKTTLNPFPGVTSGLDLNFIDDWKKQTPLDCAIENNHNETAELLRKHGGKTKKELEASSKGASAKKSKLPIPKWTITSVIGVAIVVLMLAVFNGSKLKAPNISIHQAVFNGNIEAIKQHLAAGTDVNARNVVSGETSLHLAAVYGHKEIVELLIAASADANAKMRNGRTALDRAKQHPEIADLLRKHGGKTGEELKAEGK